MIVPTFLESCELRFFALVYGYFDTETTPGIVSDMCFPLRARKHAGGFTEA